MSDREYRREVDRLIRERSGEVMLNGSHAHAAIIIERMFANATKSISILSRRLDPRVFGTAEIVEQSELFFGDTDRAARIMVEEVDVDGIRQHPLVVANRIAIEKGTLEIRLLPKWAQDITKINFALMDDMGFRFEPDKTEAKAVASWGRADTAKRLVKLFQTLWTDTEADSLELSPARAQG